MVKKAKYEPFGDELSVEVAFLQAAALLDVAAQEAIASRETERMQTIALSWMELGKLLFNGPGEHDEEADEEDDEDRPPVMVGFTNSGKADIANEQSRSAEGDTPGDRESRLYS